MPCPTCTHFLQGTRRYNFWCNAPEVIRLIRLLKLSHTIRQFGLALENAAANRQRYSPLPVILDCGPSLKARIGAGNSRQL